jgi:PAS domain S-box-containing protein/putative nucleotidyltransferase with HDIG domain
VDTTRKLLIVEDNPGDVRLIVEMLHDAGGNMTVESVETQAAAIDRLAVADVDVVLLDLGLPDSQGLETFTRLRDAAPGMAIIVFTGNSDVELAVRAVKEGAQDFLVKDRVSAELMTQAIAYAIERKHAEHKLAESEARYRTLAQRSPLAIFVSRNKKDNDEILLVNEACLKLFGASSPEELVGRSAVDLFHPDSRTLVRKRIRKATSRTVPFIEAQIVRLDGTPVDVDVSAAPLKDQGLPATQVVLRDITERKEAERERSRAEKFFRDTFEKADVGIAHVNVTDGGWLRVNQRLCDMLGYSREELLATTFAALTHPDDVDENVRHYRMMLAGEESAYTVDKRYLRKDGSTIWVHANIVMIRTEDETPDYMLDVVTDITERKMAEKALASSESRLKAMFEQAPVGIAVLESPGGRIQETNARYLEITGWSEEEMVARGWEGITHPDDVQQELTAFSKMGAGEIDGFTMAKRYVRPDDQVVWAILTVSTIKAPDLYLCMVEDITADKAAEELAVRQAEHIERTLTSVIDIAGNIVELRDPYTAGHQRRVSELAVRIAESLGVSGHEVDDIRVAGLLHDIGKAGVPTEILGKPGMLSPVEFTLIKGHVEAGYRLAVSANMAEPITEMIYQHHERLEGSGYPRGLTGDQMLLGAKVLAVADVVEAMMSHRPYRPALGIKAALAEIERGTGSLYDADVVEACVRLFNEDGFKFSEH